MTPMGDGQRERPPRAYRLLLRMLPRPFREQFGDDMTRLFIDRRREAGPSWHARLTVWARAVHDLLAHAIAERWHAPDPAGSRGRRPHPTPRPGSPRRRDPLMERLFADLRYALRSLRQAPGFTAAAVITLALGIGANVAIFTAINSVLLQPLPYPDPDRLVRVWPQENFNKAMIGRTIDAASALERVSGMSGWLFTLTGEGDPLQVNGVLVSWDHFELLGVQPALGRSFAPEEGLIGQADVVILSHGLWMSVFGGDPGVIGRRIRLAAGEYQTRRVIGVMPADFRPLDPGYRVWAPLDVDPSLSVGEDRSFYVNVLIGRLADGATAEQATAQVRGLAAALHAEVPGRWVEEAQRSATVERLQDHLVGDISSALWTLLAPVAMVLLIACVNVSNLALSRGAARASSTAIRAALGASRRRLMQQLLTESAVLGAAGCLAGLALAWAALRFLAAGAPEDFHQITAASIDPTVLAFALLASLASVILCGVLPAWRAATMSASGGVAPSSRSIAGSGGSLSQALVVAEVALAVILVAGAGLMMRSLWNLYTDDPGFDARGLLSMRIGIQEGRFDDPSLTVHYRQIWDAVGAVPGVVQAGGIHLLPMSGGNWSFPFYAEDHPVPEGTPPPSANHRIVTPSYFATMRIPIVQGRGFDERDGAASQAVGMINQTMARELWPDDDPIGKQITVFGSPFTVVGVAGDVHQHGIRTEPLAEMYRPYDQFAVGSMFAIVRTSEHPAELAPAVQRAIWSVDPDAPIAQVRTMEQVFGESVASDRFLSMLIATFGALALTLGAVGVYGVTSYTVGSRLREFGVRMAIGASSSTVMRQALGIGIRPAVAGVVVGLSACWWTARWLQELLYEVEVHDPVIYVAVPAVLIVVATIACALPAWRAGRLDPVEVLRRQ